MKNTKTLEEARKHNMHESEEPQGLPAIHGYDFDNGINYEKIVDSYATTGFQASELSKAIKIINEMRKEKEITIYLGYTSNMVSSGLRDIFRYLTKHKMVDVIVTTAGGIEEDFIKCMDDFLLGEFTLSGKELREKGINRTGNILVPNSRYCDFEDWLNPILERLYQEQKTSGEILTTSEFIQLLGKEIDNEQSIYYWAQKNNISVFCPAITDGSIGDMIYYFTYKHSDFKMDIVRDAKIFNDIAMNAKKTGVIILGTGVIKHHILNSNMLRNGCDYAVYINTSEEYDGSDSGARPDEAVSWGKIIPNSKMIKVYGDATILFPLVVAKTFAKKH